MEEAFINTPLGIARIRGDLNGIQSISVLDSIHPTNREIPAILKEAAEQLTEYFEGKRRDFTLNLNPVGTTFQKRVWNALLEVPFGKTLSYLELSDKLGNIKAIRAVAAANGKNPIWVIIPCHRIIGSDGSLTGYAGGLHRKKWLLDHESPFKQETLFPD